MDFKSPYYIAGFQRCTQRTSGFKEFLSLACTPHEEECTQAGKNPEDQIRECTALINQLKRIHGEPPERAEYFIIENHHEAGVYYEAGIWYRPEQDDDDDASKSEDYAMNLENGIPDNWDDDAIAELRALGHTKYQPAKVIPFRKTA